MTDAREIIAHTFRRSHRDTCYPDASTGECEIAASAIAAALDAAGFRIIGKDEVDAVTVERCAEVAESLAEDRKRKEQEIGGWPSTTTPFANHFWCEEIATAIRSLGRKA